MASPQQNGAIMQVISNGIVASIIRAIALVLAGVAYQNFEQPIAGLILVIVAALWTKSDFLVASRHARRTER